LELSVFKYADMGEKQKKERNGRIGIRFRGGGKRRVMKPDSNSLTPN